ncbi:uncharacterized protein LOC128506978 [Clarias gariepinus]|uniref:uncharacterized protein LOC128506978 n=1 Tax=Clarias gariepinus TaxID=13013 RepID=UPI00234D7EFE|nr:uncharacterized protein LOC128506978 [Clarias gariepinus]
MEMVLIFTFCLILAGTDAVTTVTGYRGRSVQIKCPYTSGYEKNTKYLCRAKVFTVNITDLRPEDENTYWCAIEKTWHDIYTEILLLVKTDDPSISTVSHTTHSISTHSMSTSVPAERTHSSSDFYTSLSVVPCPDYDYDEIKDNKSRSNIIYSTAPPPLNPSEIYSNTGLPTVPFDDPETVYTTVDHPSDPPDQDFYSTAQFPPVPSSVSAAPPSVVESGEHLTYAALDLDTSSGAAPAVIYKHENNSSEYATVT